MIDVLIITLAVIGLGTVVGFIVGLIGGIRYYVVRHRDDEIECTADGATYRGAFGPIRMWMHDTFLWPRRRAAHRRAREQWRALMETRQNRTTRM